MTTLRDDPPFDDQGYWPNTPSQWREPTVDDCTWYATEFAFQAADPDHHNFHPVNDIRAQSTDTEGGTPVPVALRDTRAFWPKTGLVDYRYVAWSKDQLRRALSVGATLVIGGDYEKLPLHYRRWTYNDTFNHAMAVRFLLEDDRVALYDPLGGGRNREPYDGEWIQFSKLFGDEDDFTWQTPNHKYWVGIVDSRKRARTMRRIYVDPEDVTRYVRVHDSTPIFDIPSVTGIIVKRWWQEDKQYQLAGRVDANWYMVFYWDAKYKTKVLGYIAKSDIIEIGEVDPHQHDDCVPELGIVELKKYIDTLKAERDALAKRCEDASAALPPLVDAING